MEYSSQFFDAGFFMLRTPAFPADDFLRWTSGLETTSLRGATASPDQRKAAWRNDLQTVRSRLRDVIDRPEVSHALFVASPALRSGIAHWKANPDSKKGLQAERALVRYFTRMCARCTPFGIFSGCSIGHVRRDATKAELTLKPRRFYRTKTRLDYGYLFALTDLLGRDQGILRELRYRTNTSLHKCGKYWHYLEHRPSGEGILGFQHLVKLESDVFLDAVVAIASVVEGASFSELVIGVTRTEGGNVSTAEAETYLMELIKNKLLVSSLVPLVTGDSPLDDIIAQLERLPSGVDVARRLHVIREDLAELDEAGIGGDIAKYESISASLPKVGGGVDLGKVYQVDMTKPGDHVELTPAVMNEVVKAAEILCRFTTNVEDEALTVFRNAFVERYERALIPLLDVLDEESGIGFGPRVVCESTAIRGLQFAEEPVSQTRGNLTPAYEFLFNRIASCICKGSSEVQLDLSEIPQFQSGNIPLPASLCMNVELVAKSSQALREGDFQLLVNSTYGPDGVRSLTRFCHAEPKLKRPICEYLRSVQSLESDAILAEIVHLPEGRYGNVLQRPVLREYEVVFLGRSGAAQDRQIPVSDLLVTVEENQEICLYSRMLGRRIVPRLTTAHGFSMPFLPPLYRFLGALQHQNGVKSPRFSWGPLSLLPFLPRITVGRVVITVARWHLGEIEIKELRNHAGWERFDRAQSLRERRSLPRFIELEEFDNTLLVDLDNPLSVDAFVHVASRRGAAIVREVFPAYDRLSVSSEEGRFWHELEIPLIRRSTEETTRRARRREAIAIPSNENAGDRVFAPGGEWLYCKLYGGQSALDAILTSDLRQLVERAAKDSLFDRWFFVRYADPCQHIRLRFHGNPESLTRELLPQISSTFQPLVKSGVVWKLQFDTYLRELERYGGLQGIVASEDIFRADSDAVLELISELDPSDDLDVRWRIALLGVDTLLTDCGLDESSKLRILEKLRNNFQARFHFNSGERKELGDRFRAERPALEAIRAGSMKGKIWAVVSDVFRRRSVLVRKSISTIRDAQSSGKLSVEIGTLAKNYSHMHVNRLLNTAANQHEVIVYDFLFRLYDSDVARRRSAGMRVASA